MQDRKKTKKQKNKKTSDKYTRFQKIVLLFQLSQKITICKAVLYISENYNQQSRSLHLRQLQSAKLSFTLDNTRSRKKPREKEREGEGEREKEKEGEREKEGEGEGEKRSGIMEEAGLKDNPSERTAPSEYVPLSSSITG